LDTVELIQRARRIAAIAAQIPGVQAVSLGGSLSNGLADERSDIDLHVYWRAPLADRAGRHAQLASAADPGRPIREIGDWGLEDHLEVGGRLAELVYVDLGDYTRTIDRAYADGLGDEGFATALLAFAADGVVLEDPHGELAAIQARLATYPDATRRRLLADMPRLLGAYLGQFEKAQSRRDLLFAQHRRYTIQMVFFNLLFAINRRYHPGEKRLLDHAERCPLRPARLRERWEDLALRPVDDAMVARVLGDLIDELCALARQEEL
jgi:Domain of unknown function (DUF4037)